MYRSPAGAPPEVDRTLIVPGCGVGPVVVGRWAAEDVLAFHGRDCKVSRHDPSEEIFSINYDYANDDDYDPDRPAQLTRPSGFELEFGLLKAIEIGVYQKGLATREGIRIGTTRDEVLRLVGPPSSILENDATDTLRYVHLGIELDIDDDDDQVMSMTVFRARW